MGKGWVWDWLVVRLSVVVMHSMCGYNGRHIWWGGIGSLVHGTWSMGYGIAKVFSIAKGSKINLIIVATLVNLSYLCSYKIFIWQKANQLELDLTYISWI